jgi:hypothetical protein
MLVIRALINQVDIRTKAFPWVISWALSLLFGFKDYCVYHIRCELNNEADQWEKYGSILGEGDIVVNGGRDYLYIP